MGVVNICEPSKHGWLIIASLEILIDAPIAAQAAISACAASGRWRWAWFPMSITG